MRVLLSDGSGLTARQCAGLLGRAGHHVEVLSPDPMCLCRFTRHVRKVVSVPRFGVDPLGWLDAAIDYYRANRFDLLVPTQEQVAVLASQPARLRECGVRTVVPDFESLARVQDKVSAYETLDALRGRGVHQPFSSTDVAHWTRFPAFVKVPVSTGSTGTVRGPLVMCQSVFDHGSLVTFHACERTGEGANGGASHKRAVQLDDARDAVTVIGSSLAWHGALSCDVIVTSDGPMVIDVNPRLVEPGNARRAGVDLVGALVGLAGEDARATHGVRAIEGARTHQLLIAVLGAAQHGRGRRGVLRELLDALRSRGQYTNSVEELTIWRDDWRSLAPLVVAVVATLTTPSSWRLLANGAVENYALTDRAWRLILDAAESGR